jgi:hypothetical protein
MEIGRSGWRFEAFPCASKSERAGNSKQGENVCRRCKIANQIGSRPRFALTLEWSLRAPRD